jgi:hypothetical protein
MDEEAEPRQNSDIMLEDESEEKTYDEDMAPKATEDVNQNSDVESRKSDSDKNEIGAIIMNNDELEIENRSSEDEDNLSLDSHDKL